ncbi:MAG: hypothetical protein WCD35_17225 [Mycobacteriales bacterium]
MAWVAAVVLVLVGVVGFVAANASDSSNKKTFATDYKALAGRDARTAADALDAQVTKVKTAYDAYVAAVATVRTRHEAVTDTFNDVVAPAIPLVGVARAQKALPGVIAAYEASLTQQRTTAQAYYRQLALLKALGAR